MTVGTIGSNCTSALGQSIVLPELSGRRPEVVPSSVVEPPLDPLLLDRSDVEPGSVVGAPVDASAPVLPLLLSTLVLPGVIDVEPGLLVSVSMPPVDPSLLPSPPAELVPPQLQRATAIHIQVFRIPLTIPTVRRTHGELLRVQIRKSAT
jgi:hypothetical protein